MKPVSTREAAQVFSVTDKTIRAWVAEGMPVASRGRQGGESHRIDLTAAVAWRLAREMEGLDPQRERARRDKEAADKLALENAETRGDVARVSVMESELAALIADMRANALGVANKVAPRLCGLDAAEIRGMLYDEMHALLAAIADYRPGRARK